MMYIAFFLALVATATAFAPSGRFGSSALQVS